MTGFEPETSWCWKQLLCQLSITAPYNMIVTTSLRSHASHFCPVFSFPVKLVEMIVDICGRVIRPTDQKCRDVIVLDEAMVKHWHGQVGTAAPGAVIVPEGCVG